MLDENGLILTNDHVVAGASALQISVGGSGTTTRSATLVGEEANSDLALIKTDPTGLGLEPLTLARSSEVNIGDQVYAIGNPTVSKRLSREASSQRSTGRSRRPTARRSTA